MTSDPENRLYFSPPTLRRLPEAVNLEQLRKQAKDLLHQQERQQPESCQILRWLNRFALSMNAEIISSKVALHEAQDAIAMSYGFRNWHALREWVERTPVDTAGIEPLDSKTTSRWGSALDRLARLARVPIAIIQQLNGPFIEVIADNGATDNPLRVGDRRRWEGSGQYWEAVVKTSAPLLIPDAREDSSWSSSALLEMGLVSYAGFPIATPERSVFGVLSLLDTDSHPVPEHVVQALGATQALLEAQLRQFARVEQLGARIRQLSDLLIDLRTVREIIPICSYCKRVRDSAGQWHPIEELLLARTGAHASHGICPRCQRDLGDRSNPER